MRRASKSESRGAGLNQREEQKTTRSTPNQGRFTIGYDTELDDDSLYPTRSHSSAVRYRPVETREQRPSQALTLRGRQELQRYDEQINVFVRRRSRPRDTQSRSAKHPSRPVTPVPEREQRNAEDERESTLVAPQPRRSQWLVALGIGMLVMLGLWMAGTAVLSWWHVHQDDATYGRPRTFQCDAIVGHHDSSQNPSHFIALNLNRHVEVIEFPGGDASKAKVYLGPVLLGDGQDLSPVTLSFRDVTGDGKPDMIVSIVGQNTTLVFLNDNGQFRPQRPGEHVSL